VTRFASVPLETTQVSLLSAVRDAENTRAWSRFYCLYATMVGHFVRRLGLPNADADDVTQEVMVLVHKSLQDGVYDPAKGRFRKWLYGIARNRALAALRARRRRTRAQWVPREGGANLLDQLEDPGRDEAARQVWQQEWRYALLEEALQHVQAGVGQNAFKAFTLYAIQRRPVQHVADQLGISPSSVYVYKGRVLAAVREWVGRFQDD